MKSFRRILIVQTAFAGDVVLITPLIRATKQAYPRAVIDVLLTPETAVLLKNNPWVRSVLLFDKRKFDKGPSSLIRWAKALRRNRYDLALVPHRSVRSALLVFLAGIPMRVGFHRSSGFFLFTDVVRYVRDAHEVDRNLDLLRRLGWNASAPMPELFPKSAEMKTVDRFFHENGIRSGEPFLAAAPGSLWPTKRWPAERFGDVAKMLFEKHGIRTVFIGGKNDADSFASGAAASGRDAINTAGHFTLLESAECIRRSGALVSNDSAPLHLAAAVGKKSVAVFGPTVPGFGFAPYGKGHIVIQKKLDCRPCSIHGGRKCPKRHFRCMLEISAVEVSDAVERLMLRR